MSPAEKTKGDRLKETVRLLKELQRVGISTLNPGYKEIQRLMTEWVKDGVAVTTVVELVRYGRQADITLPTRADRAAAINLRAFQPPPEDISGGSKDTNP